MSYIISLGPKHIIQLDSGYYTEEQAFLERVEQDADSFRPPGQLIYSYTRPAPNSASKGKRKRDGTNLAQDPASEEVIEFEVYHVRFMFLLDIVSIGQILQATWNAPGFREYHRRMQIFILLYIEAGSFINEEEDTWEFVLL